MRKKSKYISQEDLKALVEYKDGELYWKRVTTNRVKVGDKVGKDNLDTHGYRLTTIYGRRYKIHQLVFIYFNGYLPENDIDHIDRDKLNNKIENLREVSRQCNCRNASISCNNKTNIVGVSYYKAGDKWRAFINRDYKSIHLGYYEDFDEAVAARLAAEQCFNWSTCDSSSTAYSYIYGVSYA